jgi:hypothetical protein
MKNAKNMMPDMNHLISELYTTCTSAEMKLSKGDGILELPIVEEIEKIVESFHTDKNVQKIFNPNKDALTIEAYGVYVPMDNIKLHKPLIILFSENIEKCAMHYVQTKYGANPDQPIFKLLYKRVVSEMQTIAKLYFTSLWIIEHAEVFHGKTYGIPPDKCVEKKQFKKIVAYWMTSLIAQKHDGLSILLHDMISINQNCESAFKCLQADRTVAFEALKNCIKWDTYSVELLIALCKECCGEEDSIVSSNPHHFWWKLSVFVFDDRVSEYSTSEIRRIIKSYYPRYIHRLPFLFNKSGFHHWN